jgi:hypothetical protein
MVGEIFGGISAFKTMMDIAKTIKDMDSAVSRNAAVIELQEQIFSAHEAQSALIARVSELEAEVRRLETWEAEKKRYELYEIKSTRFTRRLKSAMADGEPTHDICAQCYNRGVKAILQGTRTEVGRYHLLVCNECKAEINLTLAV